METLKNYSFSSEQEILVRTQNLINKSIKDFVPSDKEHNIKNKGQIGNFIQEFWFGIKPNSDKNPDFTGSEIELKIVPLENSKRVGHSSQYLIKERTKICSINYNKIIEEKWETSHAKKKLDKLLFVFLLWNDENPLDSKIVDYLLYKIDSFHLDKEIIKSDWGIVNEYIFNKKSEEISETLFNYLSASTSGSGKLQSVPFTSNKIKERSFSLKPSYTKVIFNERRGVEYDSIADSLNFKSIEELENYILEKLNVIKGLSISEIERRFNIKLTKSLDKFSILIKVLLGLNIHKRNKIKEFEKFNIKQRVIRVNSETMLPYESISFKHQSMNSILDETDFEESELLNNLEKFLFVILKSEINKESNDKIIIHDFFFWTPDNVILNEIRNEYNLYRETIKNGLEVVKKKFNNKKGFVYSNNLPGTRVTNYIHMRPHGSDNSDMDISIPTTPIPKQCFWLNKSFIQKIILTQNSK
jgi:DNA mismatch repair protein MutH